MFYNLRELWEKYLRKQAQKPIPFLIIRYVVIWVILCLVLTNEMGEIYFQNEADEFRLLNAGLIQDRIIELKEKERTGVFDDNDRALIEYTMQNMNAFFASRFDTKVQTVVFFGAFDDCCTDNNENAFLRVRDGEFVGYYSCPVAKLSKVTEATLDQKKSDYTAWVTTILSDRKMSKVKHYVQWDFYMLDGYLKKDGMEFRPGKVLVRYKDKDELLEEFVIDCNSSVSEDAYTYVSDLENCKIYFAEDSNNWENADLDDMYFMHVPVSGLHQIVQVYRAYSWHNEADYGTSVNLVEKSFLYGSHVYRYPFSFLAGNIAFEHYERIYDSTGERHLLHFMGYAPGGFKKYIPDFFVSMLKYYFLLLFIMAFLGWLRYQQLYSLRARTGFHKTLVNSMAHDLKTPLMVMQGFGENLKENVHTEKREYYADQILENVAYLNGLVNKNLDLAKKRDGELLEVEAMYLMDLVAETKERYQEKLDDKKLKLELRGETLLHGDPKLVRVVIDNLINNAIKYSPEGSTINVYGTHNAFTVSNKAMLRYKKNINHLLEPLEMGEESRTAGMGTGLGLSIANGIVTEHGWKMRLYYNKKTKIFTVKIRPHR